VAAQPEDHQVQPGPPTRGSSQRRAAVQPDLISSSLRENHKQTQTFQNSINLVRVTNKHKHFKIVLTLGESQTNTNILK
jgi:hypothetical protein